MIDEVSRQAGGISPLFYIPKDFKTKLSITLQLWDPNLQKLEEKEAYEIDLGIYYFDLTNLTLVGDYPGIIIEHRLLSQKTTALLLHVTL